MSANAAVNYGIDCVLGVCTVSQHRVFCVQGLSSTHLVCPLCALSRPLMTQCRTLVHGCHNDSVTLMIIYTRYSLASVYIILLLFLFLLIHAMDMCVTLLPFKRKGGYEI